MENAERMCDAVDDAAGRRHILRVELCLFLAHLCKADFHLADEEAAFIADNLDIPFTTEEMNRYIRTHHTEYPDFAQTIPSSFARLVAYDRTQAAEPSHLSRRSLGEGGAAAYYIALFQHFGYAPSPKSPPTPTTSTPSAPIKKVQQKMPPLLNS